MKPMGCESIRVAIRSLKAQFSEHPEKAIGTDPYARARLVNGLETWRVATTFPPSS
jgi:hypothetical protein